MKLTKLFLIGLIVISLAGCSGNVSGSSASDAPASATSNASATEYAVSEYPGFGNVFIHIAPRMATMLRLVMLLLFHIQEHSI